MKDLKEKKSTLENYSGLTKKSTDDDVTFINQVPLHPCERKIRLKNLDQKVDIVNEIVSAKPKPVKAKRNTDKMKFINEQIKAENTKNLMLGNFHFDPKLMLNKRLIFDTTIIDVEIIKDRIIDAINNSYNDKYWIEHKPGTHYFTLRLENAG